MNSNITWTSPPPFLIELADQTGVEIKKYGIMSGELNAGTDLCGTFLVGDRVLDELSQDQVRAVFAHELAHKVWFSTARSTWALLAALLIRRRANAALQGLHPVIRPLCEPWLLKGAMQVMFATVNWSMECGADAIAAKFVGRENLASALSRLSELRGSPDPASLTHPPSAFRIAVLAN